MKREDLYLELLNCNNLEGLRVELENALISKNAYLNSIKSYFKAVENEKLIGYCEIDNNCYISDGFSFYKANKDKLIKIGITKNNVLDKLISSALNTDLKDWEIHEVDLFNIEEIQVDEYKVHVVCKIGNCYINKKYINYNKKLLNVKTVRMTNNTQFGFTFCLDNNNKIIAGILPVRI
jgi:hypothetical protein